MLKTNTLYNENCQQTMAAMPDRFVDLTAPSPPYDNLRDYNHYSFECEKTAKELFRVTKQNRPFGRKFPVWTERTGKHISVLSFCFTFGSSQK